VTLENKNKNPIVKKITRKENLEAGFIKLSLKMPINISANLYNFECNWNSNASKKLEIEKLKASRGR
jgi:hypothetical protein